MKNESSIIGCMVEYQANGVIFPVRIIDRVRAAFRECMKTVDNLN